VFVRNDRSLLKGIRILVLEDEKDTRDLLGFVLESQGATAILAEKVIEALDLCKRQQPDVVISDIGMPEYNGYAFIAALRKSDSPEIRDIPAIALTAYATTTDRDIALSSGFNKYIAKPFEPAKVIRLVKELYDLRMDAA
jgi:CheY-like chemotaxis protein